MGVLLSRSSQKSGLGMRIVRCWELGRGFRISGFGGSGLRLRALACRPKFERKAQPYGREGLGIKMLAYI